MDSPSTHSTTFGGEGFDGTDRLVDGASTSTDDETTSSGRNQSAATATSSASSTDGQAVEPGDSLPAGGNDLTDDVALDQSPSSLAFTDRFEFSIPWALVAAAFGATLALVNHRRGERERNSAPG
ncbi:MAG: hypothetical protein OER95_15055 [Acidimicrobiia bacterium]|nr:hypothetical protein [Acidimicrobiia bacterium]